MTSDTRADRLYWWPAAIALAGPTLLVAGGACFGPEFSWRMLGARLVVALWALAAIPAAWLAVRGLSATAWRAALSALVLPIAVFCALALPFRFAGSCDELGEFLYFRVNRLDYVARVAAIPESGHPKLAVFSRGGMVWYSEGIVYDETDEIMLPPEQRSPSWTERARHTELTCRFWARPFGDHFYFAGFFC